MDLAGKVSFIAITEVAGTGGEELFFNFWGASVSTKYFPFNDLGHRGLFVLGDFNFATQFTQKYHTVADLAFEHRFAIGSSFTLGVGYHLPLKKTGSDWWGLLNMTLLPGRGKWKGLGTEPFAILIWPYRLVCCFS